MTPPTTYDRPTRWLHWTAAVLIVMMWGGAHMIDWFPKGPLRVDARSVHIVVGAGLVLLMIYRLAWRFGSGVKFDDPANFEWRLAKAVHYLLYALIFGALMLGIANAWVRGDDLFGLGHIPKCGNYDAASRHLLANQIVDLHRLFANAVLLLACGHALVGLGHRFILKDNVLQRMLP